MKLVSFLKNGRECAGLISGDKVYDLYMLHAGLPDSINGILAGWDEYFPLLLKLSEEIDQSAKIKSRGLALKEVQLTGTRTASFFTQGWICIQATCGNCPKKPGIGNDQSV